MSIDLWPRLTDIRISFDLISRASAAWTLSDTAYRALMALVSTSAASLVWTYSPPSDGSLPLEDEKLASIAGLSLAEWIKVRPELAPFFVAKARRWHLKEAWIAIDDRPIRFAIPTAIQKAVLTRAGRVCSYCGDTKGPFDFDHIFPVSRGGKNEASNITLACAPCNRSKGAKTLQEWVGR